MKQLTVMLILTLAVKVVMSQETPKQQLPFKVFEEKLKAAGAHAQILDARSEEEYQQNHIKCAQSVPDEKEFQRITAHLSKNKPVFVYSIGNGRSGILANHLTKLGFKNVYEFPGGLSKWIGLGHPVESTVGEGLTLSEFNHQIISDKLVLVDVSSRYCGGCKKLKPVVEEVANTHQERLKLVNIEAYDNKQLTQQLAVEGLPTLILYKGQNVVWKKRGISSKEEILAQVSKYQ
ncbi:thioredoxin domain-containing protein [Olivibacter ginsenosidimutans]|uniref:Thioredoxin domain-containing protein n=1 Tax=Olivibacter ginsenosidimutans TaxID=1176537 RepID=A0ABP9AVN4_9SPHI